MNQRVVALSILLTVPSAGPILAHEGHEHKVMGTVAAIDAGVLEVKTNEGEKVPIVLTKDTKYTKGKDPASAADLKAGQRVAVTFVQEGDKRVAHEVRMASAP